MLKLIQKNLLIAIPLSMILGFFYGMFFDDTKLNLLIIPLTFLMVYPMMVTMEFHSLFHLGDLVLQSVTQLLNFIVIPLLGFLIGKIFFPTNVYLQIGIFITSLLPTSGMTISWTGFAKGNVGSAIKMTIIGLFLGSLFVPFYMKIFFGKSIDIDMAKTFLQIAYVILLPLVVGVITKALILKIYGKDKYHKDIKHNFPPISTLGVLGVVFVAIATKSKALYQNPLMVLYMILPLLTIYIINFLISTIVAKIAFKREDGIALVFGTVLRNLSIALALVITILGKKGSEAAIIIALSYIIQVQLASWYVKLVDKIFPIKK